MQYLKRTRPSVSVQQRGIRIAWFKATLLVCTLFAARAASGETNHGQKILGDAIEAIGGPDAFTTAQGIECRYNLTDRFEGQGASPAAPCDVIREEAYEVLDFAQHRYHRDFQRFKWQNERTWCGLLVAGPQSFHNCDCLSNVARTYVGRSAKQMLAGWHASKPHGILKSAGSGGWVQWLGEEPLAGGRVDVIRVDDRRGGSRTLYINTKTHLLRRVESVATDTVMGQIVRAIEFDDYRNVGAWRFPYRIDRDVSAGIPGNRSFAIRYESVTINPSVSASMFSVPAYAEITPPRNPGVSTAETKYYQVTSPGKDIWFIENVWRSYNTMIVKASDAVVVFDAPLDDDFSKYTLGVIREKFPNVPIGYVVPTHFHYDHIAGIRPFVDAGAVILTTPGNVAFFERFVQRSTTNHATDRSASERRVRIEIVEGKKTIGHGTNRVEIHAIDGRPHVDEMLLPYLPSARLVYIADLFWREASGHLRPANRETDAFVAALEKLGLKVEKIAPAHGKMSTIGDLQTSVRMRRTG